MVIHDQLTAILQWAGSVGALQEDTWDKGTARMNWGRRVNGENSHKACTVHQLRCTQEHALGANMDMWGHTH